MDFSLDRRIIRHIVSSGYEYLYDSSDLEDVFQPYRNRTAFLGYGLDVLPADSLQFGLGVKGYMRSEEDRYLLGNVLNSDGYQMVGRASANTELWNTRAGLSAEYDRKKLDWEFYQSTSLNAFLNHQNDSFLFINQFSYNHRNDDLYVLEAQIAETRRGGYSIYDKQQRSSLLYNGIINYAPIDAIQISLQENFSHRNIELQNNVIRNNADYINQASLGLLITPALNLDWKVNFDHSLAIKKFNFTQNTRHTENRSLSSVLAWDYAFGDTLSAGISVDLQRTSFPDDGNRWDNDLRNIRFNLRNVHYWHERIKLSNRLFWNLIDDVYINGVLSSNNKQTSSLIYRPECAVLFGDRILFNQAYQIRADYTNYLYEEDNKAFYRQLSLEYKLVFDSFPFAARSSDLRWLLLPYRKKGESAFLTDLTFAYERNDYADFDGTHYAIKFKNIRYTTAFTLKHDIRDVYYIIQPKYSWGTWQEYALLFGFAWKITDTSLLEFSLNPTGDSIEDLDWRTALNLSAHF